MEPMRTPRADTPTPLHRTAVSTEVTEIDEEFEIADTEDNYDPVSGLRHNPKNDGDPEHDQTNLTAYRRYNTFSIKGKRHTIDRSSARVGVEEPHKFYYVNKSGQWKKWKPVLPFA
ncbi:uncharacterized protein LTR77_009777 [Saxophila tyrrhenica]|uniref:Uncharacterized protein n=1 Tax=Saxophila tyrrhenica TaxID=1690608 RepID=A0AAV9NX86_9PEZI|nr:hypothetical protein LTR77_009777 [Saxophila tyrrhenica]